VALLTVPVGYDILRSWTHLILVCCHAVLQAYSILSIESSQVGAKSRKEALRTPWKYEGKAGFSYTTPLGQVHWRRVILDEGHSVKNQAAECSQQSNKLLGRNRWVRNHTVSECRRELSERGLNVVRFCFVSSADERHSLRHVADGCTRTDAFPRHGWMLGELPLHGVSHTPHAPHSSTYDLAVSCSRSVACFHCGCRLTRFMMSSQRYIDLKRKVREDDWSELAILTRT
jgi:hypothetical protein